jgi:cytochrome c556
MREAVKWILGSGAALAALAGTASAVQAQADPARVTAFIDQRQARMKALGGATKTLAGFAKGDATAPDARKAAALLVTAGNMDRWWPRGTAKGVGDSKASPAIWTDGRRFAQRVTQYRTAATAMNKAVLSGDKAQVAAQLPAIGASCKGCHTDFQLKD